MLELGSLGILLRLLTCACAPMADIVPVGPFTGMKSEDLEAVTPLQFLIQEQIEVMGGDLSFVSGVGETTIHLWHGSCLSGDCAIPRSGVYLIGATTPQRIVFNRTVLRFGAYFTNTSLSDDATVEFFDRNGDSLGTQTLSVPTAGTDWYW